MSESAICSRCRGAFSRTPSGRLRAHECPHGAQCVVPMKRRIAGEKPEHCTQCSGQPDMSLDAGQMPLPFVRGIAPRLKRRPKREVWTLGAGMGKAHTCPQCGCGRDVRCTVQLEGGGVGACVPAGVHGRRVCSACRQPQLPGLELPSEEDAAHTA